ncbi:MAG: sulfotransferase domain-containing protein [Chloroflexi bacterium]|nr:sulfotransferase domain-containing protein [Chloroflexota bacterium]
MSNTQHKQVPLDILLFSYMRWLAAKLGLATQLHNFFANIMNNPATKQKLFKNYTPSKYDVLVCAYGKSGTNWMLQMVTQIAHRGQAEFNHIHDVVPWPDAPSVYHTVSLDKPTHESTPTNRRAIKTHLEAEYIPYSVEAKYLVGIRDPKDALVSGFHFNATIFPGMANMGMDAWADMFISGTSVYGSWSKQVASYWLWRDRKNVMFVYFGDMKQDLEGHVRRIAEFMEVTLTEEEVDLVKQKSNFAYMKAINEKFVPPFPVVGNLPSPQMIRSGKKGEYKAELSPELYQEVDKTMQKQLNVAKSDFPYERYLAS